MPSYRARFTRLLIKKIFRRRFDRAGHSITEWRKLDEVLVRSQQPPRGTRISSVSVGNLPAEWVHGAGASTDGAILYLHGGGFIMGSPAAHRELASRISTAAGVRVLSLDYRLAPEHPFPAALDDTKSAYRWLLSQGHTPSRIVIGGESSGGGLALQALLSMREEGAHLPGAAFFLSPVTDWIALDGESFFTRAQVDPLMSLSQCQFTSPLYVGSFPRETPLLQPTKMDFGGLPPMWIQVGDHEVLLSDAKRLAQRADEAGVPVDFKIWPGLWHVFQAAARLVPEAKVSIEELGQFLRTHFSEGPGAG